MALVLTNNSSNAPSPKPYLDTWKDSEVRASCDKAASSCENEFNEYWAGEEVQFDKQSTQSAAGRNGLLASKPAGTLVQDEKPELR